MKYMSRTKSTAVKDIDINIDIADILGQKYRCRIDIGHCDIDPPLMYRLVESFGRAGETDALHWPLFFNRVRHYILLIYLTL